MLELKAFMNSSMEEVLAFKCCAIPNQNLELHVRNRGEHPVTVMPRMKLKGEGEEWECGHLFPPWEQTLAPGEAVAYYCSMPLPLWERYSEVSVFDKAGNAYRFRTKEITVYPA